MRLSFPTKDNPSGRGHFPELEVLIEKLEKELIEIFKKGDDGV